MHIHVGEDNRSGFWSGTVSAYSAVEAACEHPATGAEKSSPMVVRQLPRFQATFSGTIVHQGHIHPIEKALDLSRKGCRLESPFRASAGMKVDLLLFLPEAAIPILIQGAVVRWSGAHGIGIQFQSLTPPHQERLASTIRQLEVAAGHS